MPKYKAYISRKYLVENIEALKKDEVQKKAIKEWNKNPDKYYVKTSVKVKRQRQKWEI